MYIYIDMYIYIYIYICVCVVAVEEMAGVCRSVNVESMKWVRRGGRCVQC